MSATEHLLMPKLGLTMEEGTVARWAVEPGGRFAAGELIVVVETDKIANDVEAPAAGEMIELLVPEGTVVPVSAPIARWRLDEASAQRLTVEQSSLRERDQPAQGAHLSHDAPLGGGAASTHRLMARAQGPAATSARRLLSTPYARRLAREAGIDIASVAGTGPNGRVKAADVVQATSGRQLTPSAVSFPAAAPATTTDIATRAPATNEQSAAKPDSSRTLSFAQIEIDTRGLQEIERSLAAIPPRSARLALVAMAAARALANSSAHSIGMETEMDGAIRFVSIGIDATADFRTVAAKIARTIRGEGVEAAGGSLLIAQSSQHTHVFAPSAPAGWTAMLGIGAERETLRRSPDGTIVEAHAMTLALSYDAAQIINSAALASLESLKRLLEEPLAMLAN